MSDAILARDFPVCVRHWCPGPGPHAVPVVSDGTQEWATQLLWLETEPAQVGEEMVPPYGPWGSESRAAGGPRS